MLGIGALYYVPFILLSPFAFMFFMLLFEILLSPIATKRHKRETAEKKRATDAVMASIAGKKRADLLVEYPFLDKHWTKEQMINKLVSREIERFREQP